MSCGKAVVILTNFWDANTIIDYGFILLKTESESVYKLNFVDQGSEVDSNFSVSSIALSNPNLSSLGNLQDIDRLDFFCPTYNILKRYKNDNDWEKYTKDYHSLLRSRSLDMKCWLDSLEPNHIYILCCWENTVKGAHCHRHLIYKALCKSKIARKKIVPIYRHGNKIKNDYILGIDVAAGHDASELLYSEQDPNVTLVGQYNINDREPNINGNVFLAPGTNISVGSPVAINQYGEVVPLGSIGDPEDSEDSD